MEKEWEIGYLKGRQPGMGHMYTQGQNAEGGEKRRKEKVHLKVQNLVCPKQELWESQNISRRSKIPKFIQGQLAGSNEQEVWFGVLRKLATLERDLRLRTRKRKRACTLCTARQTDTAKRRGRPSPDSLHQEARQK